MGINGKYNPNQNHPKKGSRIRVEPIRGLKDIQSIKDILKCNPRNYLLFVTGINSGLRVGDLLKLKVKDLIDLKIGQSITIREGKTNKENIFLVNKEIYKAFQNYLEVIRPDDDAFLFFSKKTKMALTIQAVNALTKKWTKSINLKGNYGAHSFRKTYGYILRKEKGVAFEIIAERYNHSNPAVTKRYLGITRDEIIKILMYEI